MDAERDRAKIAGRIIGRIGIKDDESLQALGEDVFVQRMQ
jgi:hypothetical protein